MEPASKTTATATRPPTILVVDDEPSMREVLRRVLEDEGFCVLVAADAPAAIAIACDLTQPLDLVVADVLMPGQRGDALAAQLTARRPALPVLFLTGVADTPTSLVEGVDYRWELLHKPVWPEAIVDHVKRMLARPPPGPGGAATRRPAE